MKIADGPFVTLSVALMVNALLIDGGEAFSFFRRPLSRRYPQNDNWQNREPEGGGYHDRPWQNYQQQGEFYAQAPPPSQQYQLPPQSDFEEPEEITEPTNNQIIIKRTLQLPIISEGYASTNFQGGNNEAKARSTTTTAKPTSGPQRRRSTTATTTTPRPTPRVTTPRRKTTTVATTPKPLIKTVEKPEKLPNEAIQEYIREQETQRQPLPRPSLPVPRDPPRRQFFTTTTTTTARPQRVVPHFSVPVQAPISFKPPPTARPRQPHRPVTVAPRRPPNTPPTPPTSKQQNLRKLIDDATGEPIELYTGELITADNNPNGEEHVFLSFSKPSQNVNLGSPKNKLSLNSRPAPLPQQPVQDPSQQIYQAGYQQIEVPQGNPIRFPSGGANERPDKFNPEQVHEDRPAIQGNAAQPRDPLYPLGRPSPVQREPQLPPPHSRRRRPPPPSPANRRQEESGGSFLDFLIPSFLKSKKKSPPPPPQRPRQPPPQSQHQHLPQQAAPPQQPYQQPPPNIARQPGNRQELLPMPPPPEELLALFPPPHELGGALNPIMLNVDEFQGGGGLPPMPPPFLRPKQPRLEEQQQPAINARLGEEFRMEEPEEEDKVMEDMEDMVAQDSNNDISITVGAKMNTFNTDSGLGQHHHDLANSVVPFEQTSFQQFVKPPPHMRPQKPFIAGKRPVMPPPDVAPPLVPMEEEETAPPIMPYQNPSLAYPQQPIDDQSASMVSLPKQLYLYRMKLKDQQFHENLTKAHVFHHSDDYEEDYEEEPVVEREEIEYEKAPLKPVSYLQDSNPFDFRPKQQDFSALPLQARPSLSQVLFGKRPSAAAAATTTTTTTMAPPPVDQIAPAAKPLITKPKIGKPEMILVYRPDLAKKETPAPTTTKSTTTSTSTTTTAATTIEAAEEPASGPPVIEEEDVLLDGASDQSIADRINSLLRRYMSTPKTPASEPPSVYTTEKDGLVVEYLSPDGETNVVAVPVPQEENAIHGELGGTTAKVVVEQSTMRSVADEGTLDDSLQHYESQKRNKGEDDAVGDTIIDYWDDEKDFVPSTPDRFYVVSVEDKNEEGDGESGEDEATVPPELENLVLPKLESDFLKELVENNNLILPQYGKDYQGTVLEKLFIPSASTDESEWHILDEQGRRVMNANEFLEGLSDGDILVAEGQGELGQTQDSTLSED